jgi:formylglycine-generating enzyme required for sulfatase activity
VKRYLMLVFVLCLVVGCGTEPTPVVHDTPLTPVETNTPLSPTETDTPLPPTDTAVLPTPTPSVVDTRVREIDGMVMVYVPAGEFLMGSAGDDPDAKGDEKPQHTVYLDAFWIDKYEVTNAQYLKCVEAAACAEPGSHDWSHDQLNAPEQPVVCVSWDDAQDYAAWVGGRLPTEAEWEKAARGTDGRIYPWGNSPADCDKANYRGCAGNPLPVGSHPDGASPYGALDMMGNITEWVADWYDEDYYSQSPFRNPQGPESGYYHVLRGGDFNLMGLVRNVRCAARGGLQSFEWGDTVGFRVVVDAGVPKPAPPTPTPSAVDTQVREIDGMTMVYVPAGEFLMGSTLEEIDAVTAECTEGERCMFDDEQPQHSVYLDAYWIDRTEVTNAQYRKCVEDGGCDKPGCWDDSDHNAPDQPVVCVSWRNAQDYATWAGGRLPTEAEWEKAARGTDGRIYPWGNSPPDCTKANFRFCPGQALPVGSYPGGSSPYGAWDMAGNVSEWVADWWSDDYYSGSPLENPQGPESGYFRGVRGGCMYDYPWSVRSAARRGLDPVDRLGYHWTGDLGFRLVVDAGATEPAPPTPTLSAVDTQVREIDGMTMVYVPAGEFPMGSTDEDIDAVMAECDECEREWFADEQPMHSVYLGEYWIDRTEVTNAQYRKCVEDGDCEEPGCWDDSDLNGSRQPVVCVSWEDAQAYATWVGGRLPTEAEWEKAARGTDGRIYPWGDSFDGSRLNFCDGDCYHWMSGDTRWRDGYPWTAPVGSYREGASFYGALDMAGNVREWVADWYDEGYYAGSPVRNPQGPDAGEWRAARGGSWDESLLVTRCTFRNASPPSNRMDSSIGFRVVVAPGADTPIPASTPKPPTEAPTATSTPKLPTEAPASTVNGRIAFVSDRDGNREIYVMNADGSGQTRLTDNPALDWTPAWSPDGTRIAFMSDRDGNPEIYVMNADGSGQTRLTDNPTLDQLPAWSPDGTLIAFASDRDDNWEIYVMNADGSGQTRLTDNPALDWEPTWSPDGTRIAFVSFRDGNAEIYVMNADGSAQTRLTDNPTLDQFPAWSPDGTRIAFASFRDGNWEIYVMNADGSGQTRLTDNPADDAVPAWSP